MEDCREPVMLTGEDLTDGSGIHLMDSRGLAMRIVWEHYRLEYLDSAQRWERSWRIHVDLQRLKRSLRDTAKPTRYSDILHTLFRSIQLGKACRETRDCLQVALSHMCSGCELDTRLRWINLSLEGQVRRKISY